MAEKFHINSNGDVKPCKATKVSCQFGDGSLHFDTPEAARKVVEEIYSKHGADTRLLKGKKRNLNSLKTGVPIAGTFADRVNRISVKSPKTESKPKAPAKRLPDHVKAAQAAEGYKHVNGNEVPNHVLEELYRPNVESIALFANGKRGYRLLFKRDDGKLYFSRLDDSRDAPMPIRDVAGWNMSLHPRGPKISYLCPGCNSQYATRIRDFPQQTSSGFRTRCSYCRQVIELQGSYEPGE